MKDKLIELISHGEYHIPCVVDETCECVGPESVCYFCRLVAIADYLIAHGVTLAEDTNILSKWVSVKERLPRDEKPVLVYYGFMHKENGGTALRYTGTLSYFCFDPHPHWQHESTGLTVTHWMELPEPPKEDE